MSTNPPPCICTTCHSPVEVTSGELDPIFGFLVIVMSVFLALIGALGDVRPFLVAVPLAIAGLALVLVDRSRCPRCRSRAIVPTDTPVGKALWETVKPAAEQDGVVAGPSVPAR